MKLSRDAALEILDGDRGAIIRNDILDNSRWSIRHRIVVKLDEKYYSAKYSVGATEQQDEGPWEYEKEVEFTEVRPMEKRVTIFVPVEEAVSVVSE